jgi:hypothetical protein
MSTPRWSAVLSAWTIVVACRQAGVQSSRELVEHEAMFHFEHAHRALGRIVAKPDVAGWRKVLD